MVTLTLEPLIAHSDGLGTSTAPNHPPDLICPNESVELSTAVDGGELNSESTMPTTVRLLCVVRDSPNVFGPLGFIAGTLCLIMENCTVSSPSHVFDPQCLQSYNRQSWIYRP